MDATGGAPISLSGAGAPLPASVLEQIGQDLTDWNGSGRSILTVPFTEPAFRELMADAEVRLRRLLEVPDAYHVLFLQGGAYAHSALAAHNVPPSKEPVDFVVAGHWSRRALDETRRVRPVRVAVEALRGTGWPPPESWRLNPEAPYSHVTTAETAEGVQHHGLPETGAPWVADMTADFLTRPIDVRAYGLIYASAQKNLGIPGLTVVIAREDFLHPSPDVPTVFNYTQQATSSSRVNTPPTFAIYVARLVLEWLEANGGVTGAAARARQRSALLYRVLDRCPCYTAPVAVENRSHVTVRFHLSDPEAEERLLAEARRRGLLNLEGHPAVGGLRVALYNTVPDEAVERLATCLEDFAEP